MTDANPIADPIMDADLSLRSAQEIRDHKWLFYIGGGLSILIGIVAIIVPTLASLAAEIFIGAVLAASGLISCVTAFQARKAAHIAAAFFLGLLSLVTGTLLLIFPVPGILALTLFLAAFFVASGFIKGYFAFKMRPASGWGWILFNAVLSILLGGLILTGWPGTALWVLGLLVGIDLIFYGTSLLTVVSAAKRAVNRSEDATSAA